MYSTGKLTPVGLNNYHIAPKVFIKVAEHELSTRLTVKSGRSFALQLLFNLICGINSLVRAFSENPKWVCQMAEAICFLYVSFTMGCPKRNFFLVFDWHVIVDTSSLRGQVPSWPKEKQEDENLF